MSSITVMPRIIGYARESLCRQLGDAGEDIGEVSREWGHKHPERYAEPVGRFDRTRSLLELIGWTDTNPQEPVTVTAPCDRMTLVEALMAQLEVERGLMEEDRDLRGAEHQIKTAKRRAREIEQFLSEGRAATGDAA